MGKFSIAMEKILYCILQLTTCMIHRSCNIVDCSYDIMYSAVDLQVLSDGEKKSRYLESNLFEFVALAQYWFE